jgi:malate synthase
MSMTPRAGLEVAGELAAFIEAEALPGTGLEPAAFWSGVAAIFGRFAPENRRLLAVRDDLQARIDAWHLGRRDVVHDGVASEAFLREIGYLVDAPAPFAIGTRHVDAEVATLA